MSKSNKYDRQYRVLKLPELLGYSVEPMLATILSFNLKTITTACDRLKHYDLLAIEKNEIITKDINVDVDRNRCDKKYED